MDERTVVMIIAQKLFRDEEYFETKAELEAAGAKVLTACKVLGKSVGMLGATAVPQMTLADALTLAREGLFDAVVFVGGGGAEQYFDDADAHEIARAVANQGGVIGAICIAPAILANAGLLRGIEATSYPSAKEDLVAGGATYIERDVVSVVNLVADGCVTVTANGPAAAQAFGRALAAALGL